MIAESQAMLNNSLAEDYNYSRRGTLFSKQNLQPGEKVSTTDFYYDQELHKKFKQMMMYNN